LPHEHPPMDILSQGSIPADILENALLHETCYIAFRHDNIVGAFILAAVQNKTELVSFGIAAEFKLNLAGQALLMHALGKAKSRGADNMQVGISNAHIDLFTFFQKNGFRISGIEKDYYYDATLSRKSKNGITLRDRLILSISLQHF